MRASKSVPPPLPLGQFDAGLLVQLGNLLLFVGQQVLAGQGFRGMDRHAAEPRADGLLRRMAMWLAG